MMLNVAGAPPDKFCHNLVNVSGNVSSSSGLWRIPRVRLTVICIVLALLLVGVLIFVVVKLTGGQHSAPAQSTSQPSLPPDSYAIPGCYNPAVQPSERPKMLNVLGCASVAVALQDMSWTSWGPQGADGTGTAIFKLCDPNCAAGYQLAEPVVVHAWNAQKPRSDAICQLGLKIFGDMILAFPKDVPPPNAQQIDTQYNGMPAVHFVNYSPSSPRDTEFIGYTFCN
jgi:hypothetical protein